LGQRGLTSDDVGELEDHLREQIADLRQTGLDQDEAFLVAIKRLGQLDAVSREFARQHSDRLWKQLVLPPAAAGERSRVRDMAGAVGFGAGAGLTVLVAWRLLRADEAAFALNLSFFVWPWLVGYFAWRRSLGWKTLASLAAVAAGGAVAVNLYPFAPGGSTLVLTALHLPLALWFLASVAYCGGWARLRSRLMDFVRFSGELVVYYLLIALGGGALTALAFAILSAVGARHDDLIGNVILPLGVPGALIVAAWLVEAKQRVIENIAPVLAKVFTPVTMVMLLAILPVILSSGDLARAGREQLILFDAVLILVAALLLYTVSARDPAAPPGPLDWLHLGLVGAAWSARTAVRPWWTSRSGPTTPRPSRATQTARATGTRPQGWWWTRWR
jgi:hypothetical protein